VSSIRSKWQSNNERNGRRVQRNVRNGIHSHCVHRENIEHIAFVFNWRQQISPYKLVMVCDSIRPRMITIEPPRGMAEGADAWSALGLSRSGLSRYLRTAQTLVGLRGEVDVMLADDRTLRRLNREWRGKDKATDVLSFPAAAEMAEVHAGDLAISFDTAAKQAKEHGHTLRDEVRILMLHGLLHLAGMDHEVDRGEMAERESGLRRKLRLKRGLIARVGEPAKAKTNAKGVKVGRKGRDGMRVRVAA
jgi:probable rRNA maturation factor